MTGNSVSTSITIDNYIFNITIQSSSVSITPPSTGIQAGRIADLIESFGVNTFSSLDANSNVWGSWPSDYSPTTVIAAFNWLTNGSGLTIQGREYHYNGRETIQNPWLTQVAAATGSKFSMCIGSNGSVLDVPSMLTLAATPSNNIAWLEGSNEPNNDFGSGEVSVSNVETIQSKIHTGAPTGITVIGPSIVFGLPFPEGYITPPYISLSQLITLDNNMTVSNGHFYPPRNCDIDDGSGRGGAFNDVNTGLAKIYTNKTLMITEWHPTLYNGDGKGADVNLAAYLTPMFMLSAYRLGIKQVWWYSLFDYATVYQSGLFPNNATNPRPAAYVIRAMYSLTGDKGSNKHTFPPGKLNYTISGLPSPITGSPNTGGQHQLFQSSDGRFFIFLWNSQLTYGGTKVPVKITFGSTITSVAEYNLTSNASMNMTPIQSLSHVNNLTSQLDASVRLIVISV